MKRIKLIILLTTLVMLSTSCAQKSAPFGPQPDRDLKLVMVKTIAGQVAGFQADNGLDVFLGIPYAKPPVGQRRFAPPQPVAKWSYVRPAFRFGPTCPQGPDKIEPASLLYQDEDCLSLNIWTPGTDTKKRPVLVFIHGGGFVAGGTGDPLYNGAHLAKRGDIVVVTLNYRLSALGFLALDNFGPEFAGSGNLALQDQIAGLTWIKNNIARFGGDPRNITIMGESAGSASVMFLMISPKAKGLFKKAIAESGAINLSRTKEQAIRYTQRFMNLAGVKDVDGLRALPAFKIVELEKKFLTEAGFEADLVFSPVLDGVIIPVNPVKAFQDGTAKGIPLLNGTNQDEYRYWQLYFPLLKYIPSRMLLAYIPTIREKLGAKFDAALDYYYHALPHPGLSGVTFALANDMMFRIPHLQISDLQSQYAPVWLYRFDWKSQVSKDLGACHVIELSFIFRTFDAPRRFQIVGANPPMKLSDAMMDTWLAFIRTGNPNHSGLPEWPIYNTEHRATMLFNEKSVVVDDPDKASRLLYQRLLL